MASIHVKVQEVPPLENEHRQPSEQPIDRHLVEITDENGSVFINAGIDSTCGKKRAKLIHKLTNGIVTSSDTADPASVPMVNLLGSLSLIHSSELEAHLEPLTSVYGLNPQIPECCTKCGK